MKLINRRSAIMALKKQMFDGTDYRNEIVGQCIDAIKGLKVHDSKERKTGKWFVTNDKDELYSFLCVCSICGETMVGAYNYCPDCGAKMEVDDDEQ